jgi:hypothetical protein
MEVGFVMTFPTTMEPAFVAGFPTMEPGFVVTFPTLNGGAIRSQGSPTLTIHRHAFPNVNGGAERSKGSPSLDMAGRFVSATAMSMGAAR